MQCSLGYEYLTVTSCKAAGGEWRVHETWITKATVDRMFDMSASLGSDYHAVWDDFGPHGVPGPDQLGCVTACARLLIITIDNATEAGPPEMDLFTMRSTDARGIAIRDKLGLSPSSTSISPPLSGDFGPPTVAILSLEAGTSSNPGVNPGAYQNNVTLTVTFDRPTNRAGLPQTAITRADVDLLFTFDRWRFLPNQPL